MDLAHITHHTHHFESDDDESPKKKFEPDFSLDYNFKSWTPTREDYELYERNLWQSEFRKLLELDENSMKNENITANESFSSTTDSQYSSGTEDDLEMMPMAFDNENLPKETERRWIENHPLMIPEVIEHVLSYLDFHHDKETLDNCQLVCSQWKQVCSKRLEQLESDESFKISTKLSDLKIEDEFKNIPKYCHCFHMTLPPSKCSIMEKVFKTIGHRMKELEICFKIKDKDCLNPHIESFGDCIEQYCPGLEKLKLWLSPTNHYPQHIFSTNKNHFLSLKQIETEDFIDDDKTHIFQELINASPLLEKLSFQHEKTELIVSVLKLIARDENRLLRLKSLESFQYDIGEEFITCILSHKWNLQHLKISFKKQVSIVKIRGLLNHLKDTLTSLVLLYKGQDYDPSLPIEDNWVIPLTMKKLKHLEISPNIHSNSCRFLVNALQLENLKFCKFYSTISWTENYFEGMWSRNRIVRGGAPSLEVFEIPCSCLDPTIFLQEPNPFKNLQELELDSPSIKVLQAVFLTQTNLQRLKIYELYSLHKYTWDDIMTDFFDDLKGRPLIWDEILTGNKKPMCTMMYRMNAQSLLEAVPSVRNLTKLKYLLLDFKTSHEKVSDFLIYHGLIYLRQLQHIDINRHSFTKEAINDLREQLPKFCHLELGSEMDQDP